MVTYFGTLLLFWLVGSAKIDAHAIGSVVPFFDCQQPLRLQYQFQFLGGEQTMDEK